LVPSALITGITGQDGSYLAESLVAHGYEVHGMVRRSSSLQRQRIDRPHRIDGTTKTSEPVLHYGDLTDTNTLNQLIQAIRPDEVYNLASQSHVQISFDMPESTADVVGLGTLRLLEAIRAAGLESRFYQASTTELFGNATDTNPVESTSFHPRSPYACAKAFAHHIAVNYRESYGMHVSCGILGNHESPRRGENFVTRKITRGVAAILAGEEKELVLGNLDAARDWGFAGDYVEAMRLMAQQPTGDDYIITTGEVHTVRDFLQTAFAQVGLEWRDYVRQDPRYMRPSDIRSLAGDNTKARQVLGWEPRTSFTELVRLMVVADLERAGLDPEKYVQG
jgi:GDPmannose 4,6-dehydratase